MIRYKTIGDLDEMTQVSFTLISSPEFEFIPENAHIYVY